MLASFVTKLGTRSRIAMFKRVRATLVVTMWKLNEALGIGFVRVSYRSDGATEASKGCVGI